MSKASSGEWFDKSWNPINGRCPNACPYCYMWGKGGIGNRFRKVHDHPLRLDENTLAKIPKSGRVFVGDSTDIWHESVPSEWIHKVIRAVDMPSDAIYLFLTKNPRRYLNIVLNDPNDNQWFGATWDGTLKTRGNFLDIGELSLFGFNTFVSFEPLLADPEGIIFDYTNIKWIIIGGDSRKGQPKPPKEWADYLIAEARRSGVKVFVKDNYGYPEMLKKMPF